MIIKMSVITAFLIIINATDIKGYRIKNNVVLPTLVVGLILGAIGSSILDSLYGMLVPLVLFPLYALKMLGAGDVKAFCAIGAVVGLKLSIMTMAFSFIAGGIIAIGFMICNKSFIERIKYLFNYIKMCFLLRKIEKYDFGGSQKSYFRFSFAITAGAILAFVNHYLSII